MSGLALAAGLCVARLMPVRFCRGEPANDEHGDAAASTCNRCGISAWHPEARACTFSDCSLRHPHRIPCGGKT